MAKVTKAERMEKMRAEAMARFELGGLVRVGTGEFVMGVEGGFVELKFVVKGEGFDIVEAEAEFVRKVEAAKVREAERTAKAKAKA